MISMETATYLIVCGSVVSRRAFGCVDDRQRDVRMLGKSLLDLITLIKTHCTVVDELGGIPN